MLESRIIRISWEVEGKENFEDLLIPKYVDETNVQLVMDLCSMAKTDNLVESFINNFKHLNIECERYSERKEIENYRYNNIKTDHFKNIEEELAKKLAEKLFESSEQNKIVLKNGIPYNNLQLFKEILWELNSSSIEEKKDFFQNISSEGLEGNNQKFRRGS